MIQLLLNYGILEPMTMITDFMIAAVAAFCFFSLKTHKASKYWRLAFLFLSISALAGGLHHGLANLWSESWSLNSWKLTVLSIGGVSLSIAFEAIYRLKTQYQKQLRIFFVLKSIIYFVVVTFFSDQFLVVILEYLPNLLFLMFVCVYLFLKEKMQTHLYVVIGVVVSLLAVVIQMSQVSIHQHFNHNDLYHIVQIVGLIFYYKSAQRYGAKFN